jgi:hypothetical protein
LMSELSLKRSVLDPIHHRFDEMDVAVRRAVKQLA